MDAILEDDAGTLIEKGKEFQIFQEVTISDNISAPIKKGEKIGEAEILDNEGKIITKIGITALEDVPKATIFDYFKRNLNVVFGGKNIIKLKEK